MTRETETIAETIRMARGEARMLVSYLRLTAHAPAQRMADQIESGAFNADREDGVG